MAKGNLLFKSDSADDANKYRPISIFSKTKGFERRVSNELLLLL